ncbi:hypothetical protein [Streptoalloteichus tenebrarius]|uniref:hypothetical protein n=1 Tax=Streptoalloteichus tenebrarius (strain ATCC 17920 / DSM 40477 / JCM 4838 / CBS 697.72 / NBRC 16177 / NCIMB 11028 / NRRL B-12390 / A12253. 1 / ISP 5477) TaxID=1933 RepID=UPI0020A3923B|nr:hypothetical protein [Streptoalloteichus tenebrarius]
MNRQWTPLLAGALTGLLTITLVELISPSYSPRIAVTTVDSGVSELAARPMPFLPPKAAHPQPPATTLGVEPYVLPPPTQPTVRWIPCEYTASTEGALDQLVALWETVLNGADPTTVHRACQHLSLPGAPNPADTVMHRAVVDPKDRAPTAVQGDRLEPGPRRDGWCQRALT